MRDKKPKLKMPPLTGPNIHPAQQMRRRSATGGNRWPPGIVIFIECVCGRTYQPQRIGWTNRRPRRRRRLLRLRKRLFYTCTFFPSLPVLLLLLQMIMSIDVHRRRRRCLMSPVLLLRDTQMELFSAIAGDPNGNAATVDWKVIVGLPPGVGPTDKK